MVGSKLADKSYAMTNMTFIFRMHLPSSLRNRSFYAKFYSRHPSEIEIIDKTPSSSSSNSRILSESPTTITLLSDVSSSATSGCFSSSEYSSSESTSSSTRRRRTTGPIIQERLNTYESACIRPSLPLPSLTSSIQKTQSISILSAPSLVDQITPQQIPTEQTKSLIKNTSSLVSTDTSKSDMMVQTDSASPNCTINEKPMSLHSSRRYLSKSTSHLCDQPLNNVQEEQISSSSQNILDKIQEELVNENNILKNKNSYFVFIRLPLV